MAVTPEFILNNLNAEDSAAADDLEQSIDKYLLLRFTGTPVYYNDKDINIRVFKELQKRYAGWTLDRESGCKNESYIIFIPKDILNARIHE